MTQLYGGPLDGLLVHYPSCFNYRQSKWFGFEDWFGFGERKYRYVWDPSGCRWEYDAETAVPMNGGAA